MSLPILQSQPHVRRHVPDRRNNTPLLTKMDAREFHDEPQPAPADLAKEIIRQQWSKRHDPDPTTREQAITLIKTHVLMLRRWEREAAA